jgi:hypothetical protein
LLGHIVSMDLSLVFSFVMVADTAISRLLPIRMRAARFVCVSIFFAVQTVVIVIVPNSAIAKMRVLNHSAGSSDCLGRRGAIAIEKRTSNDPLVAASRMA